MSLSSLEQRCRRRTRRLKKLKRQWRTGIVKDNKQSTAHSIVKGLVSMFYRTEVELINTRKREGL
jgi:hypothetical protein